MCIPDATEKKMVQAGEMDWEARIQRVLGKVCKCQLWVQHVLVVRKGNTEAAGAYPPDLTDATAKKIIEAWKRILNLEWL